MSELPRNAGRAEPDQLRLLARVARLYHEQGVRQPQIAADLHISQPRVSRLLKQAAALGIVRTVVTVPPGVHTTVEETLRARYGLRDAIVVDSDEGTEGVVPALASAAAAYLDATLQGGDDIGISSWSATLLAVVDKMRPKRWGAGGPRGAGGGGGGGPRRAGGGRVVQVVGGLGDPAVQVRATRLLSRLADVTGARPVFMPTPGLVSSPHLRRALIKDSAVAEIIRSWEQLTMILVGIGSIEPSVLLRRSGNAITEAEQRQLRELHAVGDVCLRYFDTDGELVTSRFDERVVGITPEQLTRIDRRIAVAGGPEKHQATRAALLGHWVNVLITDLATAGYLLDDNPTSAPQPSRSQQDSN